MQRMITSQRAELPSEINDYFVTLTQLGLFITRMMHRRIPFAPADAPEERPVEIKRSVAKRKA
jgi:hypothetical protein